MDGYVMTGEHSYTSKRKPEDEFIQIIKHTDHVVSERSSSKKRRINTVESQSSSSLTMNLNLKLKKEASEMNTCSILQQEKNNNYMLVSTPYRDKNSISNLQQIAAIVDDEKLSVLQEAYSQSQFCRGKRRDKLSVSTGLSGKQITEWFQLRRQSEKRRMTKTIRKKKSDDVVTHFKNDDEKQSTEKSKRHKKTLAIVIPIQQSDEDELRYKPWEWDPEIFHALTSARNSTVPSDMSFLNDISKMDFRATRLPGENLSLRHYLRLDDQRIPKVNMFEQ